MNHYTGNKTNWKSNNVAKQMTPKERAALSKSMKDSRERTQQATLKSFKHKANRVDQLLTVMPKATDDNSYLKSKGIKASDNVYEDKKGRLVVPITDVKGKNQSIARINSTGSFKGYLKGGKKAGGMHMVGKPQDGKPILVAEGYSTAKTLNLSLIHI